MSSCLLSCFMCLYSASKYTNCAGMSKRVTLKEKDGFRRGDEEAIVYPHTYKQRGIEYSNYIVRGWKEKDKWQRKQFADKAKAQTYADSININLKNKGTHQALLLTSLDEKQLRESEQAYQDLGEAYSMSEAIAFYLKHHRPPEFTITIKDGLKHYLDDKEREGVRVPTRKKTATILRAFARFTDDAEVHTITEQSVISYLKTLKSRDGKTSAKKKTWNNHRNEIASFFLWSGKKDLSTNRPWTFNNPVEHVTVHSAKRIAEERPDIATTPPETTEELFSYLMSYKKGSLVKWFALAYFAGIRPSIDNGELYKLAKREDELINLTTGRIMIPADVAKTKDSRPIQMSENLITWLKAYKDLPILPPNLDAEYPKIRKKFNLQIDETRHSFISYHIALNRSIGNTAQEAGNSERMIKKHYLDHRPAEEGAQFFSIVPDMEAGKAVFAEPTEKTNESHLKAI